MHLTHIQARVGIPPRTPLSALFKVTDGWLIWTHVRDMQQSYSKWEGSYFHLYDDGSIDQVTVYEDGTERRMKIK